MITYQQEFLPCLGQDFLDLLSLEEPNMDPKQAVAHMMRFEKDSVVVTARQDARLIGYISWVKFIPPMGVSLYAQSIGWFVLPQQKPLVGINLLKKSQEFLKCDGVSKTMLGVREGNFSKVLYRYGYTQEEIIYSKEI